MWGQGQILQLGGSLSLPRLSNTILLHHLPKPWSFAIRHVWISSLSYSLSAHWKFMRKKRRIWNGRILLSQVTARPYSGLCNQPSVYVANVDFPESRRSKPISPLTLSKRSSRREKGKKHSVVLKKEVDGLMTGWLNEFLDAITSLPPSLSLWSFKLIG